MTDQVIAVDAEKKKKVTIRNLNLIQLARLDRMLEELEFGSLTLVVQKGQVRLVEITTSKKL